MSLIKLQRAFRDEIAAADDCVPASSAGMQIYRDAYRGRLLSALGTGFARTRTWVGEDAFTAAACHYVLLHPPRGWTLDDYGAHFPAVLAALFASDPEVAEIAWIEWHTQQAFAAKNQPRLDPAALAAAGYDEADWARMRFAMAPGFAMRSITTNCAALWTGLAAEQADGLMADRCDARALAIWRTGLSPRLRELEQAEFDALIAIAGGAALGQIAEVCDADLLGQWLTLWLSDGVFSAAVV